MKYRWKKTMDKYDDEEWSLYLILDGKKYEFADVTWYPDSERWSVFVSGFVSEVTIEIETVLYELLCDAKTDVLNYAKVWWVSGVYQRKDDDEKLQWQEIGTS